MLNASSQPDPSKKSQASDLPSDEYRTSNARHKILIVDDHPLFLDSFEALLRLFLRQTHIVTAGSLADMRASILQHGKDFDCVLLDLELPDASGIESLRTTLNLLPQVPILVVSGYASASVKRQCLSLGAHEVLDKSLEPTALAHAATAILSQRTPRESEQTLAAAPTKDENFEAIGALRPREMDVLKQMLLGHGNRKIAQDLDIAYGTVKVHVTRILRTLRVDTRAELIARYHGKR